MALPTFYLKPKDMEKFLYFAKTTSEAVALPVSHLRQIAVDSDSDALTFRFEDIRDGIAEQVILVVRTTSLKGKEVKDRVANEILHGKRPFIVIADDINGEYIHRDLTSNIGTQTNVGS